MTAGSAGLDLSVANYVVFVETSFTPAEHKQAENRIHRIGQKAISNIYRVLAEHPVEQRLLEVCGLKENIMPIK